MAKLIAVIDDDPDIVEIIKTTLKMRGYDVITAPDGEDGLRLVQQAIPDLVLLDLRMPKLSGLEVCRRMREDVETKDIPIIVLSAVGEKSGKSEEFWRAGLGTEDFISKPYDPMALLGRVEAVLRRRQYVSNRKEAAANGEAEASARVPLSKATPREVVRCFIEAWNSQNFGEEYNALGEPMRGPIEKPHYVARRQQAYATASHIRQRLVSVIEEEVVGETARVLVEREDTAGNHSSRRREEYALQQYPEGWRIVGVKVQSK
jgi:CheY-like chemotaxis protein